MDTLDTHVQQISLSDTQETQISVLSWNVKDLLWNDIKAGHVDTRLDRVCEIILNADPDIIVFEEAKLGNGRPIGLNYLRDKLSAYDGEPVPMKLTGRHTTFMFFPLAFYKRDKFLPPIGSYLSDGRGAFTENSCGLYEPYWWKFQCKDKATPPFFVFSIHFAPSSKGAHDKQTRRFELDALLSRITTHTASCEGTPHMEPTHSIIVGDTNFETCKREWDAMNKVLSRYHFKALNQAFEGGTPTSPVTLQSQSGNFYDNTFLHENSIFLNILFTLVDKLNYHDDDDYWTFGSPDFISDHFPILVKFGLAHKVISI